MTKNYTANPVLEGAHNRIGINGLGQNDGNKGYTSNTVLPNQTYENQYQNKSTKNYLQQHANQIERITQEGRLEEYEGEEDNIVCGRFPHLKFCCCEKSSMQNLVSPTEIVSNIYIGP